MLALAPQYASNRNLVEKALLRSLVDETVELESTLIALSDHERRQKSYQLIDHLLTQACDEQPLIIVFEDLHWIDATSQEYLYNIIRLVECKRLIVIVTTRPIDPPPLIDAVLHLSPLSQKDCYQLLVQSAYSEKIKKENLDTLVARSAGNPFFLEELAFASQTGADPSEKLPETVQAVIAVRIGSLTTNLRTLLYVISVIGPPASIELMAHLLERNTKVINNDLEKLIKAGFILEDMGGFTFRHMLINDTAYSMIAKEDRRRLHYQIADFLADTAAKSTTPEKLAWHYQEAGETNLAISYWIAACRAALQRSTHLEAVAFAKQGVALIDMSIPEHKHYMLDLQLLLASTLTTLKGFGASEAGEAYYHAQSLNHEIGTAKTRIRVLVGLWIHTWVRGNLSESLSHASKLMELANASKHPALCLQAHASMGQVLLHLGEIKAALKHLKMGLTYIKTTPPQTLREQNAAVSCAAYAAWCATLLNQPFDATNFYEQSHQLTEILKNPFAEAIHCGLCTEHFMFEGKVTECLSISDRAVSVSRKHNFNFWLGTGLVMRGWALGQLGQMEPALAAIDEGIAVFEATGAGVQLANWYGLKAETLLAANKHRKGLDAVNHAIQCAKKAGDVYFLPRIHAVAAQLNERIGLLGDSEQHTKDAQRLAKQFDMGSKVIHITNQEDSIK